MNNFVKFFEIPASDVKRAVEFYSVVFNLKIQLYDWGEEKMGMFPENIGAIVQHPELKPSEHGVLLSLDGGKNLNHCLERVVANGGKVVIEKTKIEADNLGFFAVFRDSEGNRIGLYSEA